MGLLNKFCDANPTKHGNSVCGQVVDHLINLFNSQAGFSSFEQAYGLVNYNGEVFGDALIHQIKQEIQRNVLLWEKRFELQQVQLLSQQGKVIFRLCGRVAQQNCQLDFIMER